MHILNTFLYTFPSAYKENLFDNHVLLQLPITFFIFMNLMSSFFIFQPYTSLELLTNRLGVYSREHRY